MISALLIPTLFFLILILRHVLHPALLFLYVIVFLVLTLTIITTLDDDDP